MISRADGTPLTKEERVALYVETGMDESEARFMVAIEDGDIDGDIQVIEPP